jgi:cytochrome c oxidase subunit 2
LSGPLVLEVFLILAACAIGLMLFLALYRAHDPVSQDAVSARGYAIRRYWFLSLLCAAVAVFIFTIPHFPYGSARTLGRHYTVVAQQYSFVLPASVPADAPVVFDVTSRDVNHGFGIYDPQGKLVGQVQAMPDYVNHLPFRFHSRGHYTVRCLEYCGIAHAAMQGGFDVR